MWWVATRQLIFAIVLCAVAFSVRPAFAEFSISASTDLRGSISFLGEIYQSNGSKSTAGNQSFSSGQLSSSSSSSSFNGPLKATTEQFRVFPALRLGYRHVFLEQQNLLLGIQGSLSYVKLRARYPNGFRISKANRNFRFTEPVSFSLESVDFGLGPYVQWRLMRNLDVNIVISRVDQHLKLSSTLGSWALEDRLQRSFIEWSSSVEYTFFDSLIGERIRPSIFLSIVGRPEENVFGLGLRFSFN